MYGFIREKPVSKDDLELDDGEEDEDDFGQRVSDRRSE